MLPKTIFVLPLVTRVGCGQKTQSVILTPQRESVAVELCKHTLEGGVAAKSTILWQAKDKVIQILQQLTTIQVVLKDAKGSRGSALPRQGVPTRIS